MTWLNVSKYLVVDGLCFSFCFFTSHFSFLFSLFLEMSFFFLSRSISTSFSFTSIVSVSG